MSSHHFIREDQEPALILANPVYGNHISELLEWAPTIIVLEDAIDFSLRAGTKVDIVISTDSHAAHTEAFRHQEPVMLLPARNSKEAIETGLSLLIGRKQRSVNIVCSNAQETIGMIGQFIDTIEVNVVTETNKYSYHPEGVFKKWLAPGHDFELKDNPELRISGQVKREGEQVHILQEGMVEITSTAAFWLIEKID
jgi:hypothetical protein